MLRSSRKVSTFQNFLESCLLLAKDPDALVEIVNLLHQPEKGQKDYAVNSLHKKKMGKEMQMGEYGELVVGLVPCAAATG